MLLNAIPGAYRANKKPAKPIYAQTLAYGIWHILRLNSSYGWPPEQISLRIDALLAGQTLKDNDGWTGDTGLRPVSRTAVCRYIYGLNGNERNER